MIDCLCFWAPSKHNLHRLSVPPRAGAISALQWRMAISTNREKTLEECKRDVDECAAQQTSVPEYRAALIAMAEAWLKIAERAKIKASR
jgi:hypothetical protein